MKEKELPVQLIRLFRQWNLKDLSSITRNMEASTMELPYVDLNNL